jgi:hypothetical protein
MLGVPLASGAEEAAATAQVAYAIGTTNRPRVAYRVHNLVASGLL